MWNLHRWHNYEEANKEDSYLHVLIPRKADGSGNEQCAMFHERANENRHI